MGIATPLMSCAPVFPVTSSRNPLALATTHSSTVMVLSDWKIERLPALSATGLSTGRRTVLESTGISNRLAADLGRVVTGPGEVDHTQPADTVLVVWWRNDSVDGGLEIASSQGAQRVLQHAISQSQAYEIDNNGHTATLTVIEFGYGLTHLQDLPSSARICRPAMGWRKSKVNVPKSVWPRMTSPSRPLCIASFVGCYSMYLI